MHDIEFLELFLVLIKNGFSIQKTLELLEAQKRSAKYALRIKNELEKGAGIPYGISSLSPKIRAYESILCSAAESGDISPALELIIMELKEKQERRRLLAVESAYPVFVLLLAQLVTIFLIVYGPEYLGAVVQIDKGQMIKGLLLSDLWLFLASLMMAGFCIYITVKNMFEKKLFCSLGALIKCDKNLERLLKTVIQGRDFKERDIKAISLIIREIRSGLPFYEACRKTRRFDEYTLSCLYAAEESGEVTQSFERISNHYTKKNKDGAKIVGKVIESGEILICGIYILLLVIYCAVPIFENLGGTLF